MQNEGLCTSLFRCFHVARRVLWSHTSKQSFLVESQQILFLNHTAVKLRYSNSLYHVIAKRLTSPESNNIVNGTCKNRQVNMHLQIQNRYVKPSCLSSSHAEDLSWYRWPDRCLYHLYPSLDSSFCRLVGLHLHSSVCRLEPLHLLLLTTTLSRVLEKRRVLGAEHPSTLTSMANPAHARSGYSFRECL